MVGIMAILPQAALIPLKLLPLRLCGCVRASTLALENGIRDDSLRLLVVVSYLALRGDEVIPCGRCRAFDGQRSIGGLSVFQEFLVCRDSIALDEIVQKTLRPRCCSIRCFISSCALGAKARVSVRSNGPYSNLNWFHDPSCLPTESIALLGVTDQCIARRSVRHRPTASSGRWSSSLVKCSIDQGEKGIDRRRLPEDV
jgi:hypothetical protein